MSKEFLERMARGELTNIDQYQRMKSSIREMQKEDRSNATDSQEWQMWELSPVWSATDEEAGKPVDTGIRADSVQHALDQLDKF